MALANKIRREVDITIRTYETRFVEETSGDHIKTPVEKLYREDKQINLHPLSVITMLLHFWKD